MELERTEQALRAARAARVELERERAELQRTMHGQDAAAIAQASTRLDELRRAVPVARIAEIDCAIAHKRAQMAAEQQAKDELTPQIIELSQRIAELTQQRAQLQAQIPDIRGGNSLLRQQIGQLNRERDQLIAQLKQETSGTPMRALNVA